MTPATIAALNWLSFAALIVSGIGCLVCAGWMLTMVRLGRDLDRESEHGFRLPESKGEREQLHAARSLKL